VKSETQPPAIDIRDLRVDYGNFLAVDHLTLQVPRGEVFGLVGPNGAGKTSTFRVLASLQEPTYGSVRLADIDILEEPERARNVLGYMPDLAPVPSDMKVWEFLDCFADAHRLGNAAARAQRVAECLAEVRLSEEREKFCKTLSRGQTQRLVLAKTLLHRPSVLILDEPASGMDPLSRRHLRLVLRKLAEEGATVIVSSHILSELAEMCTSICVMNRGRLLASGSVEEVRRTLGQTKRTITAAVLHDMPGAHAWLSEQTHVTALSMNSERISFSFEGDDEAQAGLLASLIERKHRVTVFEEQRSSFEDILIQVAESNNA
jgi:ABC-2 type transport system ATP-binding protein